ncbi:MAG: hypothetical protein KJO82_02875, partial [Gammaproteobacteria bacterium]|nr:hypothetical protein [Gammaproteobacteria bacterium]
MHRVIVIFVVVLLSACARINASNDPVAAASDIKSDETVVFFRTAGWLNAESQEWHLPVHGWIYEPEDSDFRLAAIEKVLEEKFDLSVTKSAKANFTRRVNLLLADNERGKNIIIKIADRVVELPASAENGHFESIIVVSADDVAEHADDGFIHFTAVT